ncbi:MAG: hypothetical protein M3Y53_02285 [Thermoproteota archaeon]|nr:hypothetical protein [Thermoproteota archaeon]
MEKLLKSNSAAKSTVFILVFLLLGSLSVALTTPFKQVAYAHTFTGDESASFLSVIRILQAESNLVQTNLASNLSLAQEHGKAVVGIVNANHTFGILPSEVSENNKRVSADIVSAANALQTAVKSNPAPTQADVKGKIDNLNATLQEAIAVRLPKDHVSNSTINGEATKNLVNETLRQYGYAFGISGSNGGNASNINSSASANSGASPSRNTVMNVSAYQSTQALASQAQRMLTETRTLPPTNVTSTTTLTITKIANDLLQLKNTIDTKSPYGNLGSLVQKTIYPDLNAAFGLK